MNTVCILLLHLIAMKMTGKIFEHFGIIVKSTTFKTMLLIYGMITQRNFSVLHISLLAAARNRLNLINKEIDHKNCSLKKFKELLTVHSKFCDVINLLNQCLSANLIMSMFEFMFQCTMLMFSFYNMGLNESSIDSKIYCIMSCINLPPQFFFMMSIIINSSLLKMEAKRTLTLVHSKNSFSTGNPEILKLLHLAALKIEHHMPMISCGLFIVDWKFLFAFISGIVSCVVILIQFDSAR